MYTLPTEIQIRDDITLHIRERGDFRVILDCFSALQDEELSPEYRFMVALFIFYEDFESIEEVYSYPYVEEALKCMFNFFSCGYEPQVISPTANLKLIDWDKDAQLISSAINRVAGKEIRAEAYIHWWTFMGYYNAVGESSLSTIVSIRKKILEGKKLEKQEREFKRENPDYFIWDSKNVEQKELDNMINDIWNK